MIDLTTLPEPQFFEVDWEQINSELKAAYEQIVEVSLTKAQVESLILATFAYRENLFRVNANDMARQNLLAYAQGDQLDHLGALLGVARLEAQPAVTTLRFNFSGPLAAALLIPAGTRAASQDNLAIFETTADINAAEGDTYGEAEAECIEAGEVGTGYLAGEINQLVDPLAYVASVENITLTSGGSDTESNDNFKLRIQLAPESFSVAGPEGAYIFWAKTAHPDIVAVAAWSPQAGQVKVVPLLKDGEIPGENILQLVSDALSNKKVRPLTDQVIVEAPVVINYTIDVEIYIYKTASMLAGTIEDQANELCAAYAAELKGKLGADIVPEQIGGKLQQLAGVYRAVVNIPGYEELAPNEVAICEDEDITVTIAGSVDG